MSDFQIVIPKLGESVQEAVITKIFVSKGDNVDEDDALFEIATDKVDSEIPSPVSGVISEIRFKEDDKIAVGETVMVITTETFEKVTKEEKAAAGIAFETVTKEEPAVLPSRHDIDKESVRKLSNRFYSPLVKNIAAKEGVTLTELESIKGSGEKGRVQKKDILEFIEKRKEEAAPLPVAKYEETKEKVSEKPLTKIEVGPEDTIVKMDRVRKIIADHMVLSKQTSPHVLSVVETDVTNIVQWRNKVKEEYEARYGEKLTYLPIFVEAVAGALSEFPKVNASVDGDSIILRKHINIGIAVATKDENLIVPVIRDANKLNIIGITEEINRLAKSGRENKLTIDEIQGGTFTITNFGSFGNIIGAPIINQPQIAILATGIIEKKPAVIETETGDAIAIRYKMYLSLSFDHRAIDGMYGGKFLKYISDTLEKFDVNRKI